MTERPRMPLEKAQRYFVDGVPHNVALGLRIADYEPGRVVMELPYQEKLVGNPSTGVIHGGVITTLIDSTCGGAVLTKLHEVRRVATLDLRIDYLRPAKPGQTVTCEAVCYRVTHHVAFVRASAHDGDPSDPVAAAAGSFVVFEPGSPSHVKEAQ